MRRLGGRLRHTDGQRAGGSCPGIPPLAVEVSRKRAEKKEASGTGGAGGRAPLMTGDADHLKQLAMAEEVLWGLGPRAYFSFSALFCGMWSHFGGALWVRRGGLPHH